MKKVAFALLALVALAFCAVPGMAFAGETSADIGGVVRNIASAIFNNVDTAIILLGVASFALNQISQIWAWSADSRMGKIQQLIEGAISGAYLLKGQPLIFPVSSRKAGHLFHSLSISLSRRSRGMNCA